MAESAVGSVGEASEAKAAFPAFDGEHAKAVGEGKHLPVS